MSISIFNKQLKHINTLIYKINDENGDIKQQIILELNKILEVFDELRDFESELFQSEDSDYNINDFLCNKINVHNFQSIQRKKEKLASQIKILEKQNSKLKKENDVIKAEYEKLKNLNEIYFNKIIHLEKHVLVYLRIKKNSENVFSIKNNKIFSKNSSYQFKKIFLENTSQKDIFSEFKFILNGISSGYSSMFLCYGQTGSGKTYTMEGSENNTGLFLNSISFLLSKNMPYLFSAVEIYNSTITYIFNQQIGYAYEEIINMYKMATMQRKTAITKCNQKSSRSHFIIIVQFKNENMGKLVFVDLAGSERIKKSGVKNTELEEAKNINKSLLELKNIFTAIHENASHVPYRNSKLTYFLKEFINEKIQINLIINIIDSKENYDESVSSLCLSQLSNKII